MSKGKYAGNEHIINDMEGIKVANTEDLVRLLEAKDSKVQVTSENSQEQLSFLDLFENPNN